MRLSEADWALLNAHADGELSPDEARALERKLAVEPALASELERLRGVKAGLAGLRAKRPTGRGRAVRRAALAASLAGLLALGLVAEWGSGPPSQAVTVAAIHDGFSGQEYEIGQDRLRPAAVETAFAAVRAPDLTASNLVLVDLLRLGPDGRDGAAWHYRGPRGCRVTLIAGDVGPGARGFDLEHRWQAGTTALILVAEGMDPRRFAAIAAFAETRTRGPDGTEELRVALVERTASANPCV